MKTCKLCKYEPKWEAIDTLQSVGFCQLPLPVCITKFPIYAFNNDPTSHVLRHEYNFEKAIFEDKLSSTTGCSTFKAKTKKG